MIWLIFVISLGNTTCLKTNNYPGIIRKLSKSFSFLFIWLLYLVLLNSKDSFGQFLEIYHIKGHFLGILSRYLLLFGEIFVQKYDVWPRKGQKSCLYFEYCAIMSHSALFRRLIWPFFVNTTCSKTLFRGFQGLLFDFWRDINIQDHCSTRGGQKITKLSDFCPQSGFFSKYGVKMEPLGLQSKVKPFFHSKFKAKLIQSHYKCLKPLFNRPILNLVMQIYQKNLIAICENINGDYNLVSIDYGPKFYIFFGDICHSPCRC